MEGAHSSGLDSTRWEKGVVGTGCMSGMEG